MAAYNRQALPLLFVDSIRSATLSGTPNGDQDRILARLDKWVARCTAFIQPSRQNEKNMIRMRTAMVAATARAVELVPGPKQLAMFLTAGLILVEEAWRQAPRDRRMPWLYLLHALRDMYLVMEPDWGDPTGPDQVTGQALGEAVWRMAQ
jgi:hypothetical protein